MLRINRSRFFGIFCLTVFIYFLLFTDSGSSSSSDFRTSTEAGLARIRAKQNQLPLRGDLSDEDLTKKTYEELRGILASQSKETLKKDEEGNSIGRDSRQEVFGDTPEEPRRISENTGRRTHAVKESKEVDGEDPLAEGSRVIERPKYPISGDSEKNLQSNGQGSEADSGDTAKDDVREKLAEYLKNPVVIFSKTYCPHSKRAKQLLLDVYNINPTPLVVELDLLVEEIPVATDSDEESHVTLGKALQDLLGEISGRKTVPNIMIGGSHSIGGNDKIWGLHESGLLAEEIKKLGGRKLTSVDVDDSDEDRQR